MMGYLLAIETATDAASIAVLTEGGELVGETTFRSRRTLAERLVPTIDMLLERCDLGRDEVGAVAVGLGPGSFTSVRVGVATAKGIALAGKLPLIGIGSLDALAAAAPLVERQPVCAVIPAPKRHVYAALYARLGVRTHNRLFGPELLPLEQLAERLTASGQQVALAGRLTEDERRPLAEVSRFLPVLFGSPRAALVGLLGLRRIEAGEAHDPMTLTPLYVQPSEPEVRLGRTFADAGGPEAQHGGE